MRTDITGKNEGTEKELEDTEKSGLVLLRALQFFLRVLLASRCTKENGSGQARSRSVVVASR
jgi:hypothetical protein